MDEKLSIKQIQNIMKWSYPTALRFAQKNGEQVASELWPRPRWFVPREILVREISQLEEEVTLKWAALDNAAVIGS
jgi:hypothetical protein